MFLQILIAIIVGVTAGTFTGLIPGIHINLIAVFILSIAPLLLTYTQPFILITFILAMAITHTFLDSIPGIYLGAPDEAMALSVLPGHRLLLKGEGHTAVTLTVVGSFFSLIIALVCAPILLYVFPPVYTMIKDKIGYLLIAIMLFMIFKDKKKWLNLTFFLTAGVLGILVLNMPNIGNPLLPLLSGLFGISMLIISLNDNTTIPKQNNQSKTIPIKSAIIPAGMATIVGSIAAFLPGFSSSQSAVVAQTFMKNIDEYGFLILVGGINTVNMMISSITLYSLQKARNGAVLAISQLIEEITFNHLLLMLIVIIITASIAVFLSLSISKIFARIITKINYKQLVLSVISVVSAMVILFSGAVGVIIFVTATALGIVSAKFGIAKQHLMGCLIVPVIIFFL